MTTVLTLLGAVALAACGSSRKADVPPVSTPAATITPPATTPAPAALPARTTTTVVVPAGNGAAPFDVPRTLTVPAGTVVTAWARIDGARFTTWTPEGDLLVSTPRSGAVRLVRSNGGANPTISTLLNGLSLPQGMAFDTIDGVTYLYVIENGQLNRFVWNNGNVGTRVVLIKDLPGRSAPFDHPLKTVVVGSDHTIYLDVGSSSNADPADRNKGQALIASYRPDGTGRQVLTIGVRNGDGLAFDPNGQLWTAVNERDRVTYPIHGPFGGQADAYGKFLQEYGNDHPSDQIAKVIPGRDLGWPYCDPDQDLSTGSDRFGAMQFRRNTDTNPDGRALDCATLTPVERGLQAHSAPLGLEFLGTSKIAAPWRDGAVVATHGSNNHVPPLPGSVLWMHYENGTLGPAQDLLTGFVSGDDRWGRPVDATAGGDGALYVTDDTAGVVYRVTLGS